MPIFVAKTSVFFVSFTFGYLTFDKGMVKSHSKISHLFVPHHVSLMKGTQYT